MSQAHEIELAEGMRSELTGFCYRMMGSVFEAEDAVQDTLIRVWQNWNQFRQESSRKTWIYRIATNVCLDRLRGAKRRALPMDLAEPTAVISVPKDNLPQTSWIWPVPDAMDDPADLVMNKESIRLSFIALLQILPPRQRAVLILLDVFRWSANEAANALGMTTAAVNSAAQRARATMARSNLRSNEWQGEESEADPRLLDRYVNAFEQYDIDALVALFHEEGSLSMPPFTMWVRGSANLSSFYTTTRSHCLGSRLLPVRANGDAPAYAHYVPSGKEGVLVPWSIQILELTHGKLKHIHHFIAADLFVRFGLPASLDVN